MGQPAIRSLFVPRSLPVRPLLALALCLLSLFSLLGPGVPPALAAGLSVNQVSLDPCPSEDIGSQPQLRRPVVPAAMCCAAW